MYIPQKQLHNLKDLLMPGKVIVLYGPRRVGKTTLLEKFLETAKDEEVLFVNGDDIVAREYLESQSIEKLKDFVGMHSLLVIDEAQYVEKIVGIVAAYNDPRVVVVKGLLPVQVAQYVLDIVEQRSGNTQVSCFKAKICRSGGRIPVTLVKTNNELATGTRFAFKDPPPPGETKNAAAAVIFRPVWTVVYPLKER